MYSARACLWVERIARANLLAWRAIDFCPGDDVKARDATFAEATLAVEDQQRSDKVSVGVRPRVALRGLGCFLLDDTPRDGGASASDNAGTC